MSLIDAVPHSAVPTNAVPHSAVPPNAVPPSPSRPRSGLTELAIQVGLIGAAVLLYFGVRGLTEGSQAEAVRHGFDLLRLEAAIGLDIEAGLQQRTVENQAVVTAMNWVYIWGHWPVITATLLWLHRTRRHDFVLLRNAMFASGAIGLIVFVLYPVAPPRLLGAGMVDTVTELSNSYRVLQPPSLVNKYAALPSLHVGWNLLVGIAIVRATERRWLRWLGVLSPVAMTAAVVLTANHYVVDAVAGAAVALAGWWIATTAVPAATARMTAAGRPWIPAGDRIL